MNAWTAVFIQGDHAIVAYVEELPGAMAQGATIEEATVNLREALEMIIAANRRTTWQDFKDARVIKRERLTFGK